MLKKGYLTPDEHTLAVKIFDTLYGKSSKKTAELRTGFTTKVMLAGGETANIGGN